MGYRHLNVYYRFLVCAYVTYPYQGLLEGCGNGVVVGLGIFNGNMASSASVCMLGELLTRRIVMCGTYVTQNLDCVDGADGVGREGSGSINDTVRSFMRV